MGPRGAAHHDWALWTYWTVRWDHHPPPPPNERSGARPKLGGSTDAFNAEHWRIVSGAGWGAGRLQRCSARIITDQRNGQTLNRTNQPLASPPPPPHRPPCALLPPPLQLTCMLKRHSRRRRRRDSAGRFFLNSPPSWPSTPTPTPYSPPPLFTLFTPNNATENTHNGDVMAWTQSTANTKYGLLS